VFGGGVELTLACDFIVAARDAIFRQIEVSVESMPMAGGVQRMAERSGRARCRVAPSRGGGRGARGGEGLSRRFSPAATSSPALSR
jgi:hypothetical protein